jgi:hypothetical protein
MARKLRLKRGKEAPSAKDRPISIRDRAAEALAGDRAEINDPLYLAKRDAFARSRL